jgi:AcrR family transcriptional regulator
MLAAKAGGKRNMSGKTTKKAAKRPTKKTTSKAARTRKSPSTGRRDAGRARGQAVVDMVLDCTLAELATHGLSALSVDRIAKAADANKTSIYRRFATRDALVVAALSRVHADLTTRLIDTGSLRGDLVALERTVAAFPDGDVGRAVARAGLAGPIANDVAAVARAGLAAEGAKSVQALLHRARARGEWRDDADPAVLLAALGGGLLHRGLLEQAAFVDGLVDLVVAGCG